MITVEICELYGLDSRLLFSVYRLWRAW